MTPTRRILMPWTVPFCLPGTPFIYLLAIMAVLRIRQSQATGQCRLAWTALGGSVFLTMLNVVEPPGSDPLWIFLVISVVPALIAAAVIVSVRVARGDRRRAAGCCAVCGYDLTGNTTDVCSECGEQI